MIIITCTGLMDVHQTLALLLFTQLRLMKHGERLNHDVYNESPANDAVGDRQIVE